LSPTSVSLVVSPELTVVIGRGPIEAAPVPHSAIAVVFGLGAIGFAAAVRFEGAARVTALLAEDAGATRIVLLIAPSGLDRIAARVRPDDSIRLSYHLPTELRFIALALRDSAVGGEAGDIYRSAKAIELLFETWRFLDAGALVPADDEGHMSQSDCRRLMAAKEMIEVRCSEKLSLDAVAREVGLNREKLTRGFKEMFDCTVAEAIAERRLVQASQMLLTTDLPVSSIGYENGYLNNASFARAFGRRFGLTPSDFRARRLAA
jgi:AraC family transcriptional regulator, transcriptional activator of the genes for pyochelin and ferripyochelin receptors